MDILIMNKMASPEQSIFLLNYLLCFFFCCPFVFCQLSPTQRTSMITLSEYLNNSVPWDIIKESSPCSWKRVKCSSNNSSVLEISLSGDLRYEFAPKGTLFDSLHKSSRTDMDWVSRYSVAVGVAQGLAFLHGIATGPILLLDLSTKNIFLKSVKEPLVRDIELYKVIDQSKSTGCLTTVAGSVGYIPPGYAYTMRITMAANVYSFGVTLLELLTGKQAVSEGTELGRWALTKSVQQDEWDQILDSTISKTSPTVSSQTLAVLKVALGCIRESPEERPAMNGVLQMLIMQNKSLLVG